MRFASCGVAVAAAEVLRVRSGDVKLRARVRTAEGEWSAMEFVDVNGYTANDEDVAVLG